MKKIILVLVVLACVACKKNGVVYKASYTTPTDHTYTATNYFYMDYEDDGAALEFYKGTEAYKEISAKCDTFWIEYWGTYEEWKSIGK